MIRTNLTKNEVLDNMIELCIFLKEQQGENANDIEVELAGVHLHFEVWTDVGGDR